MLVFSNSVWPSETSPRILWHYNGGGNTCSCLNNGGVSQKVRYQLFGTESNCGSTSFFTCQSCTSGWYQRSGPPKHVPPNPAFSTWSRLYFIWYACPDMLHKLCTASKKMPVTVGFPTVITKLVEIWSFCLKLRQFRIYIRSITFNFSSHVLDTFNTMQSSTCFYSK